MLTVIRQMACRFRCRTGPGLGSDLWPSPPAARARHQDPGRARDLKVHINASRGGVPEIPSTVRPPIAASPPELPNPIEIPQMRGGGLVGGIMPDGTLPYLVHPPEAGDPDLPVIGDGIPDHRGQ